MVCTNFDIVDLGRSANSSSRTREMIMPPWEWPTRTTLVTVGSARQALT